MTKTIKHPWKCCLCGKIFESIDTPGFSCGIEHFKNFMELVNVVSTNEKFELEKTFEVCQDCCEDANEELL